MGIEIQGADTASKIDQQSVFTASISGNSEGIKETKVKSAQIPSDDRIINLDHGDPTIYESYWKKAGDRCSITIRGDQSLSYFANPNSICWFMEPALEEVIKRLHCVVGNAKVDDHHIVVGNGSSQLIQAAFYALCPPDQPKPASVVSVAPFYSTYQEDANLLRSTLFRWMGDANEFIGDGPYVEMVTSPNNPDGAIRAPVVNRSGGHRVYDLAYYWPQYTAITSEMDEDVMLFTASKCTGHAGSRIGWALVRDLQVAQKMIKFIQVSTIGVSKESQLKTAKILSVVSESCEDKQFPQSYDSKLENFFLHGRNMMSDRWKRLRRIVETNKQFSLPNHPLNYCKFSKTIVETYSAFAWMSLKSGDQDLAQMLSGKKILARSGCRFGSGCWYARISMLSNNEDFNLFLERLAATQPEIYMHQPNNDRIC